MCVVSVMCLCLSVVSSLIFNIMLTSPIKKKCYTYLPAFAIQLHTFNNVSLISFEHHLATEYGNHSMLGGYHDFVLHLHLFAVS